MDRLILSGDECDGECLYIQEKDDGIFRVEMVWDMGFGDWKSYAGDLPLISDVATELRELKERETSGFITVKDFRENYCGDEKTGDTGQVMLDYEAVCALFKFVENVITDNMSATS